MKMIMDSPAILILRWVQRQFPVLKPPGIKDSFPLMSSPILSNNELKNDQTLALATSKSAPLVTKTRASLKE